MTEQDRLVEKCISKKFEVKMSKCGEQCYKCDRVECGYGKWEVEELDVYEITLRQLKINDVDEILINKRIKNAEKK